MSPYVERLDRVFSLYIRLSHATHQGFVTCYTCEKVLPWEEAQNGHFIPRANMMTRFSEDNCKPQCRDCNEFRRGMVESFEEHLRDDLGDAEVDLLIENSKKVRQYDDRELKELIAYYRARVKAFGVII